MQRPYLQRWAQPLAEWYHNKMGYKQLGLRYEDLLPEDDEVTQLALKRLPPKEAYDRVFRIRRAFQVLSRRSVSLSTMVHLTFRVTAFPFASDSPRGRVDTTRRGESCCHRGAFSSTDNQRTGRAVPVAAHRGDRGRDAGARGPRVHGAQEEVKQVIEDRLRFTTMCSCGTEGEVGGLHARNTGGVPPQTMCQLAGSAQRLKTPCFFCGFGSSVTLIPRLCCRAFHL